MKTHLNKSKCKPSSVWKSGNYRHSNEVIISLTLCPNVAENEAVIMLLTGTSLGEWGGGLGKREGDRRERHVRVALMSNQACGTLITVKTSSYFKQSREGSNLSFFSEIV